jgi:hypothetical protein
MGATGPTGATGLPSRTSANFTTGSIAADATATSDTSMAKMATVISILTDYPAWVRIYGTSAARTADSGRLIGVDPSPGAGVYVDVLTTGGVTLNLSPIPFFVNNDGSVSATAYFSVVNKDTVSRAITVTTTFLPMEI